MADDAQPPEGQGAETGSTPYSDYLDRIPEEVRGDVEPVFKEWDQNVTRRFQEASEYRKTWEPFEETGINQLPPEDVQWLVGFRGILDDPQAVQAWFDQYSQEAGLTPQEQAQIESDPEVQQLVQQQLQEHLNPVMSELTQLREWQQEQQQQVRDQAAKDMIDRQITELKDKHGDFPVDIVEKFIAQYIETDPEHAVPRAFEDWQSLVSQTEKQLVAQKLGTSPGAESGGTPNVAPDALKGPNVLKQAAALAAQRMAAARD